MTEDPTHLHCTPETVTEIVEHLQTGPVQAAQPMFKELGGHQLLHMTHGAALQRVHRHAQALLQLQVLLQQVPGEHQLQAGAQIGDQVRPALGASQVLGASPVLRARNLPLVGKQLKHHLQHRTVAHLNKPLQSAVLANESSKQLDLEYWRISSTK